MISFLHIFNILKYKLKFKNQTNKKKFKKKNGNRAGRKKRRRRRNIRRRLPNSTSPLFTRYKKPKKNSKVEE